MIPGRNLMEACGLTGRTAAYTWVADITEMLDEGPGGNTEIGEDTKGNCRVPWADAVVQQEKDGNWDAAAAGKHQTRAMYKWELGKTLGFHHECDM